jgi:hypothetical protein
MAAVDHRSVGITGRLLSEQVREATRVEIESRAIGDEELASLLGLSQTALYSLSLKDTWPLDLSVRIAEVLGLQVELRISPNGDGVHPEARAA